MCMCYMWNIYGDFICTPMSFTCDFEGFWTFIFLTFGSSPHVYDLPRCPQAKIIISKPLMFVLKLKHGERFISFIISHTNVKQHALPSHVHKLYSFEALIHNLIVHQTTIHLVNKWSYVNVFFSKNKQFAWKG
jgi:hypothetical protein